VNKFNRIVILLVISLVATATTYAQMSEKHDMKGMKHSMSEHMPSSIMVMNGWVRLSPPVAKNGAAYFMLHNSSDQDVTVIDVQTTVAETAALHDVVVEMSMAKMVHLKELKIPAGKMVNFTPGGKHLMLINLKEKLELGKSISVTFKLSNGEEITSVLKVKSDTKNQSSEHEHKH